MKEKLLRRLKELSIVHRTRKVNLKYAGSSDLYIDVKMAYGDPEALNLICGSLFDLFSPDVSCVAAEGYGAISPASVISARRYLKLTLVRDKVKDHGIIKEIDGYTPTKHDVVAIIDDVLTTGGSLKETIEIIKPTGAKISGCYVVVKRGEANLDTLVKHIFTLEELL